MRYHWAILGFVSGFIGATVSVVSLVLLGWL